MLPARARVLLLAAVMAFGASTARAEGDDMAQELFDRGLAEMLAGRYESGCPAIAESLRLAPRPGTLFTLAECEARWDKLATAADPQVHVGTPGSGLAQQ